MDCYRIIECSEACRTKKADLEKELRMIRRELKAKEELANEREEELRQLRQYKESNDLQVCFNFRFRGLSILW